MHAQAATVSPLEHMFIRHVMKKAGLNAVGCGLNDSDADEEDNGSDDLDSEDEQENPFLGHRVEE